MAAAFPPPVERLKRIKMYAAFHSNLKIVPKCTCSNRKTVSASKPDQI